MTSKNIARPLAATALLAALALTGCSAPQAGSAPSSAAGTSAGGESTASASATPSPSGTSGPFGGFTSAAEACSKISEQATGATLLPLSAAQGKTAELEQFKTELAATAERVPDSLKADFANLKEVAVAGVTDQTVFSSGKLQAAMAPVTTWIATNCK
ncbi:hypothetical protein [Arthrobacter sp. NicSoilC12]|uniref:hypothetical protein n=1 Tax=Arthrobacter sp. NicSoilC12 TaxID=2831001 RepID=UPI001CC496CC|nr:hypothetical protein [Arthrobacter sp. NicSoilC12]GIU55900.1 hypothetical protein NicSoilC12_16490 [Arthrobacter sp. NicSoilC12]